MIYNFSAGPSVLPSSVIQKVQQDFANYAGTGASIIEISHRSPEFIQTIDNATKCLIKLLDIPQNYRILFMQGGATAQFSAVIYNILCDKGQTVDYLVTGAWSQKAFEESQRLGVKGNIVLDTTSTNHDGSIPDIDQMKFSNDPAFIYYCDNETISGVEFPSSFSDELANKNIPIVCDMSSNILSRPVNISNFGVLFAGAQKNIGPAGVTIVIIRQDLIKDKNKQSDWVPPIILDYKVFADSNSLYNTPPTFSIYVSGLVFEWILKNGGLEEITVKNQVKSDLLYDTIEKSSIFKCTVKKEFRSRMNVTFRIWRNGRPDAALEKEFLTFSEKSGLIGLAGHRSVGGIRASIYNAMDLNGVQELIKVMKAFQDNTRSQI